MTSRDPPAPATWNVLSTPGIANKYHHMTHPQAINGHHVILTIHELWKIDSWPFHKIQMIYNKADRSKNRRSLKCFIMWFKLAWYSDRIVKTLKHLCSIEIDEHELITTSPAFISISRLITYSCEIYDSFLHSCILSLRVATVSFLCWHVQRNIFRKITI